MSSDTQVLVTGGTGFIGRHVVRVLLAEGHRVRLLCREATKARRLFADTVGVVEGDLLNRAVVEQAVGGSSCVYHLAGHYAFGPGHYAELHAVNVLGTRCVLQAANKAGVERVLHLSTAGVLEAASGLIEERHFPSKSSMRDGYKASKWKAEQEALTWAEKGLGVVIASPTCPIGPEDERPTPTGRILQDFIHGRLPAISKTGLNFADVRDVAEGIVLACSTGRVGQRYLLGGKNLWLDEFIALVAETQGTSHKLATVPWPLIAAAGLAGEIVGRWLGCNSTRLCWETAVYARRVQFFDCSKAERELGWNASRSLSRAVRDAVDWFQHHASVGLAEGVGDVGLPNPASR